MVATSPPASALIIGVDPSRLNSAQWGVQPEENAAAQPAIEASLSRLREAGYTYDTCLLSLNADLEEALVPHLAGASWTVIVIGGGPRKPPELLDLFEQVVNVVH